jgi:hypothetical protein
VREWWEWRQELKVAALVDPDKPPTAPPKPPEDDDGGGSGIILPAT